jgi:hypothetical protein
MLLIIPCLPFIRRRTSALRIENALGFAKFFSPSHDAVIRVYDAPAIALPKCRIIQHYSRHAVF